MLEIKDIHKKFGELEILKGIDLRVQKGDIDVILGQSGSGKTTLLRCIDFLEFPDSGGDYYRGYSRQLQSRIQERSH